MTSTNSTPGSTDTRLLQLRDARAQLVQLEKEARAAIPKHWSCGVCGYENHPRSYGDPEGCEQCGSRVWDPGHTVRK